MFDLYYVMRSVTFGQRGRELLGKAKIPCRLQRSPRAISPSGCAYAICVDRDRARAASAVFTSARLPYEGPFLRTRDDAYQEWKP